MATLILKRHDGIANSTRSFGDGMRMLGLQEAGCVYVPDFKSQASSATYRQYSGGYWTELIFVYGRPGAQPLEPCQVPQPQNIGRSGLAYKRLFKG